MHESYVNVEIRNARLKNVSKLHLFVHDNMNT